MTSAVSFPASAPTLQPRMGLRRVILTLVLFAISIGLGVAIHNGTVSPDRPIDRFPTINTGVAEPAVTAQITKAIAEKDPRALASAYSADLLSSFQEALAPVVDVDEIHYAGGLEREGETLASYVATGLNDQGQSAISGFVIHVQNGQISSFN